MASVHGLTVLQDISNDTEFVKVSTSTFTTKRLLELDHDSLDILLVQKSLGRDGVRVCKDQVRHLLDGLDGGKVVHSVHFFVLPAGGINVLHHLEGRVRVLAKRFLNDETA